MIARDDVTCLVLAPGPPSAFAGRSSDAAVRATPVTARHDLVPADADGERCFSVDVRSTLERKVAALAAHRSQYALEADVFPRSMLERLLGTEHFAVVERPQRQMDPAPSCTSKVVRGDHAQAGR